MTIKEGKARILAGEIKTTVNVSELADWQVLLLLESYEYVWNEDKQEWEKPKNEESLVIYCGGCGALFFAVVNEPQYVKSSAKEIAEALADGGRLGYVSHQTVREKWSGCTCVPPQPSLF